MRLRRTVLLLAALLLATPLHLGARDVRPTQTRNAAEIRLALKKLGVVGNALYVAAHPDDENTAMLAWLANERLLRTAYLSVTRGDGGQNLIGNEKGDALGVIRTQELLAARRVDGAEQYFTRAVDFGYSKTPQETLEIWGRDEILADIVRRIRLFQPDVIITRFPTNGDGGHGHHTSSALLAEEAFDAAADPQRFPEQLAYTKPWRTTRLLWNAWVPQNQTPDPKLLSVDVGAFNALLGQQYTEIASDSRTMHKSQGFGVEARRGSAPNYFELRKGAPAQRDLFEGVDLTWNRINGGSAVAILIEEATRNFDEANPAASLPILGRIHDAISKLAPSPHVDQKLREAAELIVAAGGVWLEAIVADPVTTRGEEIDVALRAISRNATGVSLESVSITPARSAAPVIEQNVSSPLAVNKPWNQTVKLRVDAPVSAPYWLLDRTESSRGGIFNVEKDAPWNGEPEITSPYTARFTLAVPSSRIVLDVPLLHRWTDRVHGELYRALTIAPVISASFDEQVLLFTDSASKELSARVSNESNIARDATVRVVAPAGWKIDPPASSAKLAANGGSAMLRFRITPPANASTAELSMAVDSSGHRDERARSKVVIGYEHIPHQTMFPFASARAVRADVKTRGRRVGYVSGSGDDVPQALRQLGYTVEELTDETIASGELGAYDAIVLGVRAFNTRDVLKSDLAQLFRYAERGGTVIVQYNTSDDTLAKEIAPYPLKLGRDRVTLESAPVKLVAPEHRLLNQPNRITAADFDGWVQERGLYFASTWDPKFQPLLAANDPGEKELTGGLLVAQHGKGLWVNTGYAFFRQLPAGVPGAYRLFANLVSAKSTNKGASK